MRDTHEERIDESFTRQAATFEDERLNVAFTSGVPWLLDHLAPTPEDRVLDVAAGTGIVARALVPDVAHVTAVDRTPAMIEQGRQRAADEQRSNLAFLCAEAERLPFADETFTVVLARFLLHHLEDPQPALAEMVRVCRRGGRVVVKDLVASTDPVIARRQDGVERLRDSSHVRMPQRGDVPRWLAAYDMEVRAVRDREIDRPLEPWLEQSVTEADAAAAVRAELEADLAGGDPTGLRPHRRDDELWFHQLWEVTVASRR